MGLLMRLMGSRTTLEVACSRLQLLSVAMALQRWKIIACDVARSGPRSRGATGATPAWRIRSTCACGPVETLERCWQREEQALSISPSSTPTRPNYLNYYEAV